MYEKEIAVLSRDVSEMKDDVKEILTTIKGTNGKGLSTRIALNEASITRMWKLLAGVVLAVTGAVIKVFWK